MNISERSTTHAAGTPLLLASLRAYLNALQESGLDGIPVSMAGALSAGAAEAAPPAASAAEAELGPESRQPETLEKIRQELGNCQRCGLAKSRKNLVFGAGNPRARLVFVGEGPGADEDLKGEPFVGEVGQVLNRIIAAMELKREDVYLCSVVKCCLPGNRDPETDETAACSPFLQRQIRSIQPEVIVALGSFTADTLLGTREPVAKLRGKFRDYHGIPLMATHHPSLLLRRQKEGNLESFWEVWDDMTQVLRLLKLPVPEKSRKK